MKPNKLLRPGLLVFLCAVLNAFSADAQTWNPAHAIGPVGGMYDIVYNQSPAQLIETRAAAVPNTGLTYQWEKSLYPTTGFAIIAGANQSSYTPASPLTQTTYFKRKTTHTATGNYLYSNTIKLTVVSASWEDINYVREHDVNTTVITTWSQVDALPIGPKLQTTTYLDGLGRSLEKVSRETATPANNNNLWGDVVQYSVYDPYGREVEKRLPYTTTTQSGKYKSNPKPEQEQYYSTVYNETAPYSSLTFDDSPLERVLNVKEPGTSWSAGSGKSVAYDMNTAADDVQNFSVDYVQGNAPFRKYIIPDYPNYTYVYPDNTLYKSIYADEAGKKVVEYRTKAGLVVLKKVELEDSHPTAYAGWICTYFIYDDFGQLRFQLQPEAVNYLVANNWSFAGTTGQQVLAEWCFQYFYDDRGRTVWKKAPGAEPLYMAYDNRDRLVFTQDGNQRTWPQQEWTATLYDILDRPILTTLFKTPKNLDQMQQTAATGYDNPVSIGSAGNPIVYLVVDSRDPSIARYAAQSSIEFNPGFETAAGDEFTAEIDPAATEGGAVIIMPYQNPISAVDLNDANVCTILKYQFYDDYSFAKAKPFRTGFTNTTAYNTTDPNVQPIAKTKRTLGFPTGSLVRVLGTATFLATTSYYDERGSLIQSLSDNIKAGTDVTTLQYHFDGRVLSSWSSHTTAGTGYSTFQTLTKYLFDKLGRVTSVQKSFGVAPLKTISAYDYDDVGRVKTKHLDPGYTGGGGTELESLNYSFNIHNQLTGINKDYALKAPGTYNKWGHFFGLYLGYDNRDGVFAAPNLNGQVTGLLWNTQGDDAQRRYDYTYDNAGRLTKADFKEQGHPSDGWALNKMDFSVLGNSSGKIKYDLNGNLLEMLQKGVVPGQAAPLTIDDLHYDYYDHSNKLKNVTDAMTATALNGSSGDFKDGTNNSGTPDYVYDNNGNLVIDLNKNVKDLPGKPEGIHYNYLDKPDLIRIAGKGTISITYSAQGEKLQRTFTPENGTATTTTYISQFVYQASGTAPATLSYINFEEGRIRVMDQTMQNNGYDLLTVDGNLALPNSKRGVFDYYILDYQQNVRMILSEETHIASSTASMETGRASVEEPVFGQAGGANEVAATRYPSGNTGWQHPDIGGSVSRLGGIAGHNVGPNTLQKVMAGDAVTANVQYYYNTQPSSNSNILPAVVGSLLQALSGGATTSVIHQNAANVTTQLTNSVPFQSAVQPTNNNGPQTPQAYLTLLFFDERFNLIDAQDGGVVQQQVASSVSSNGSNIPLVGIKAPKNGYVYAYVSNLSNTDVYFDNFAVSITQGNILEENHYYAFGLKIAAISSKRTPDAYEGKTQNNFFYNGKESLDEDADLGWLDYGFRSYDPQIGRFPQLDPLTDDYPFLTPYQYASNDPITNIDIDGLEGSSAVGAAAEAAASIGGHVMSTVVLTSVIKVSAKANVGQVAVKIIKTASYVSRAVSIADKILNAGPARAVAASTCQGCGNAAIAQRNNQAFQFASEHPVYDPLEIVQDGPNHSVIGTRSYLKNRFNVQRAEYNEALGDAIASGPFASLGYHLWGDKGAFALQYLDQGLAAHVAIEKPGSVSEPTFNQPAYTETPIKTLQPKRAANYGLAVKFRSSVNDVMGESYRSVAETTTPVKKGDLLGALQDTSPGDWVKVYEAGMQNENKVEIHYFRNNNTKQVFDVKLKYNEWHQKAFKNLSP